MAWHHLCLIAVAQDAKGAETNTEINNQNKNMKTKWIITAAAAALVGFSATVQAIPITGGVSILGGVAKVTGPLAPTKVPVPPKAIKVPEGPGTVIEVAVVKSPAVPFAV